MWIVGVETQEAVTTLPVKRKNGEFIFRTKDDMLNIRASKTIPVAAMVEQLSVGSPIGGLPLFLFTGSHSLKIFTTNKHGPI